MNFSIFRVNCMSSDSDDVFGCERKTQSLPDFFRKCKLPCDILPKNTSLQKLSDYSEEDLHNGNTKRNVVTAFKAVRDWMAEKVRCTSSFSHTILSFDKLFPTPPVIFRHYLE